MKTRMDDNVKLYGVGTLLVILGALFVPVVKYFNGNLYGFCICVGVILFGGGFQTLAMIREKRKLDKLNERFLELMGSVNKMSAEGQGRKRY